MQISYLNYDPFFLFWSVIENVARKNCPEEQLSRGTMLQGTMSYRTLLQRTLSRGTLIYDGTGSKKGGTGWYLVVLGQYEAVLVGTW